MVITEKAVFEFIDRRLVLNEIANGFKNHSNYDSNNFELD